jgi:hypothetical protein
MSQQFRHSTCLPVMVSDSTDCLMWSCHTYCAVCNDTENINTGITTVVTKANFIAYPLSSQAI